MVKITICPTCGSNKIKRVRCDWTGQARGQAYTVPNLEYWDCPDCDEKIFDVEAMRKIQAYSPTYANKHRTLTRQKAA